MLSNNITTLELFTLGFRRVIKGQKVKSAFNVGTKNNFRQVFGSNPLLWFFPVFSSEGDGCYFPVNSTISTLS